MFMRSSAAHRCGDNGAADEKTFAICKETLFERWARMKIDTPPQQERPLKRSTPLRAGADIKTSNLPLDDVNSYLIS
jgi:hypothetical protein